MDIHRVGVIGAGQMGSGIAHVCALAGFEVALNDVSEDRVKAGIATINGNMARQVAKNSISEGDRKAALGRIVPAPGLDALAECARHEGILPAIETAHAIFGGRKYARAHPGARILIGCSGRGDKDMSILERTLLKSHGSA